MKSEIKIAVILGVIIVISIGLISALFSSFDSEFESVSTNGNKLDPTMQIDKSKFKKAPDIVGIAHYLNTTPEKLALEME